VSLHQPLYLLLLDFLDLALVFGLLELLDDTIEVLLCHREFLMEGVNIGGQRKVFLLQIVDLFLEVFCLELHLTDFSPVAVLHLREYNIFKLVFDRINLSLSRSLNLHLLPFILLAQLMQLSINLLLFSLQ
jgi:hypothetical protein